MFKTGISCFIICLLLSLGTASAATIHVPDDHATIQAAINTSANGDIIVVRAGTYFENIDFLGKAVTVMSEEGSDLTVIDGSRLGSVVMFVNGEGADSVLQGFTITNGFAVDGGGIHCNGASPTVNANIIYRNEAVLDGGGICCLDSGALIAANTFTRNTAGQAGGGVAVVAQSDVLIVNNIIVNNSAGSIGGGIAAVGAACRIINDTLSKNSAGRFGGGVAGYDAASAEIVNTILWEDHAPKGAEIHIRNASAASVSYSDVMGGQSSTSSAPGCQLVWDTATVINKKPRFEEGNTDFHIAWQSKCRDSGTGDHPDVPGSDFEGDPRTAGGLPDIGADEVYLGQITYPVLDIKCNGQDDNIYVNAGENVLLTISIAANDFKDDEVDIWVIGKDPSGDKYSIVLNPDPGSGKCYWELRQGWCCAYFTGGLYSLVDNVLNRPLPPGHYKVWLGIDLKPNGKLNAPWVWDFDVVEFDVLP